MHGVLFYVYGLLLILACAIPRIGTAKTSLNDEQVKPFFGQWKTKEDYGPVCKPCSMNINRIDIHTAASGEGVGHVFGAFATAMDGVHGIIGFVRVEKEKIQLEIITLPGKSLKFELPQDDQLQGQIKVNPKFSEPSGDGRILIFYRIRKR